MTESAGESAGVSFAEDGRDRAFDSDIVGLISLGSRVIDLGCGDGDLLARLREEKSVRDTGVESSGRAAAACIARGLNVVQGRMEEEVRTWSDSSFDTAVLNQVITLVPDPLGLLGEALRIARKVIITFPNFTHWRVRLQLFKSGCLPVTPSLPYEWHNSPHVRYVSVEDFRRACRERRWRILEERFLHRHPDGTHRRVKSLPGLRASLALFHLQEARRDSGKG